MSESILYLLRLCAYGDGYPGERDDVMHAITPAEAIEALTEVEGLKRELAEARAERDALRAKLRSGAAVKAALECPCCGDVGAESDDQGFFFDGQGTVCGCGGWVSLCSETEPHIVTPDDVAQPRGAQ